MLITVKKGLQSSEKYPENSLGEWILFNSNVSMALVTT